MLSSSVVLQPLVLLASDVLHQLRHQPDPLQHHVLQVVGHLFLLQGLDELQDHNLDQSAGTGSESGSEDFLAAAILLRDQPPTLNQQGFPAAKSRGEGRVKVDLVCTTPLLPPPWLRGSQLLRMSEELQVSTGTHGVSPGRLLC